jgi:hypothetical protein
VDPKLLGVSSMSRSTGWCDNAVAKDWRGDDEVALDIDRALSSAGIVESWLRKDN